MSRKSDGRTGRTNNPRGNPASIARATEARRLKAAERRAAAQRLAERTEPATAPRHQADRPT